MPSTLVALSTTIIWVSDFFYCPPVWVLGRIQDQKLKYTVICINFICKNFRVTIFSFISNAHHIFTVYNITSKQFSCKKFSSFCANENLTTKNSRITVTWLVQPKYHGNLWHRILIPLAGHCCLHMARKAGTRKLKLPVIMSVYYNGRKYYKI